MPSLATQLLSTWQRLAPLPGGKWLFSRLLGRMVPYTGSIGATVVHLEPGHARLELADRRAVRNHLNSVHAVALVNFGEVTTGLALLSALDDGVRGIVTHLEIDYRKKARGPLTADCRVTAPSVHGPTEHVVATDIRDAAGDPVATIRVRWQLDRTA